MQEVALPSTGAIAGGVVAGAALLFAVLATGGVGAGGDEAASGPRLARLRCNLCVFWWPRKRLRAAELPGAVAAGEDRMEPGRRSTATGAALTSYFVHEVALSVLEQFWRSGCVIGFLFCIPHTR